MADCITALTEWTGKAHATIINDSTVDEFTADSQFNKVRGKENIAIVGFTTDGDVFGGFYSAAVTEQDEHFFGDPNIFVFSFESHGRCKTPQRFDVKKRLKESAFVRFSKDDWNGFVEFGVDGYGAGGFWLGNERSKSFCWNISRAFEGLENTTLTGNNGLYYHCTRLVAIQLE